MARNTSRPSPLREGPDGWTCTPQPEYRHIRRWTISHRGKDLRSMSVVADLDGFPEWRVTVDFALADGAMMVRRVEVAPSSGAGPRESLSTRVLRAVQFREISNEAWALLADLGDVMPSVDNLAKEFRRTPRPGRRGRPDLVYAEAAAIYVASMTKPAPLQATARALGIPEARARSLLGEARRRGLLTQAPKGRAGGELTEKARRLLDGTR